MSNHGYKVRSGYFQGVCIGNDHLPLEQDRTYLDWVVEYLGQEAVRHTIAAERLASGADLPEMAIKRQGPYDSIVYHSRKHENEKLRGTAVMVPWHEATEVEQKYQRESNIGAHYAEARAARSHAYGLMDLARRVHGQPLIDRDAEELAKVAERKAKKAPIEGAYRTKQAQKYDMEKLNRKYSELRRKMIEVEGVWEEVPFDLHHFNPKRSASVLAKHPQLKDLVLEASGLYVARELIKSMPVIK
jgi:hypothetical protein